ncbi:DUF2283 domain-containing protein [Candidatus Daviesbacteria bacterium]|nr:DUF2283 domain-containing protein [Candidatus Daviesbacteria bacterium]
MKKSNNFRLEYDKEGDILYLSKGALTKDDSSEEMGDDVVIWKNKKTKEVSGFTVLNFSKRASKKSSNINLPFEVELHPTVSF